MVRCELCDASSGAELILMLRMPLRDFAVCSACTSQLVSEWARIKAPEWARLQSQRARLKRAKELRRLYGAK